MKNRPSVALSSPPKEIQTYLPYHYGRAAAPPETSIRIRLGLWHFNWYILTALKYLGFEGGDRGDFIKAVVRDGQGVLGTVWDVCGPGLFGHLPHHDTAHDA